MPPPSLPVGTRVVAKVYGDSTWYIGTRVVAKVYGDNTWYPGVVAELGEGRLRVDFNDGDVKWYTEKSIPKTLRTTCHGQRSLCRRHPYHMERN